MKIGIIGGTGLDDPKLLEDYKEKEVTTKFGKPSSKLTLGKIKGVDVVIIPLPLQRIEEGSICVRPNATHILYQHT